MRAAVLPAIGSSFEIGPTCGLATDAQVRRASRIGELDVYNLFNANPVMQEPAAYAVWWTPQRVTDACTFKISGQLDCSLCEGCLSYS
jgi:hypothetical protein